MQALHIRSTREASSCKTNSLYKIKLIEPIISTREAASVSFIVSLYSTQRSIYMETIKTCLFSSTTSLHIFELHLAKCYPISQKQDIIVVNQQGFRPVQYEDQKRTSYEHIKQTNQSPLPLSSLPWMISLLDQTIFLSDYHKHENEHHKRLIINQSQTQYSCSLSLAKSPTISANVTNEFQIVKKIKN